MWDMLFGKRKKKARIYKDKKSGYSRFEDSGKLCHRAVKEKEQPLRQ